MSSWRAQMHARLVACTEEPGNAQACWLWRRKVDRHGYAQVNVWVPGLRGTFTMKAHILMWLLMHVDGEFIQNADDAYLAYKEHVASGLHLDHLCNLRGCISPEHTQQVSHSENMRRRDARRAQARSNKAARAQRILLMGCLWSST